MSLSGPILITGGAGSVGRLLVQRCREANLPVRVFDLPFCDFSGLEGESGIEVVKGDITNAKDVAEAVRGVGAVAHLAALLPPASEANRDRTFAINVEGTASILQAMADSAPGAVMVFSSSVSTYGDTRADAPPVQVSHAQTALDIYAESKIASEARIRESSVDAVILRIAGVSVPVLQEPPEVWPFTAEQRLEMVHRDDVVTALFKSLITPEARGKTLNIGGGPTWQIDGRQYVADHFELIGVPVEMAAFRGDDEPGWVDWYDSTEAQQLLDYQHNSYASYLDTLREEVMRMLEDDDD
jgi:nucleoside-diphosphate-sugar epimerase